MELYQYLLLVIVWVLGAVWGWFARERQAKRMVDRFMSQFTEETTGDIPHINITIEKHNGIIFIYNKDTSEFMVQGATRTELDNSLKQRYPGVYFAASAEHLRIFDEITSV